MTRTAELTPLLKRLQLGPMAATLPERIALARREQLDYASFLEIILSDEINRRAHRRIELRLHNAGFEETCRLEDFNWSASITLDRRLLDAVFSLACTGSPPSSPPTFTTSSSTATGPPASSSPATGPWTSGSVSSTTPSWATARWTAWPTPATRSSSKAPATGKDSRPTESCWTQGRREVIDQPTRT